MEVKSNNKNVRFSDILSNRWLTDLATIRIVIEPFLNSNFNIRITSGVPRNSLCLELRFPVER